MLGRLIVLLGIVSLLAGCGDPALHPITGKVSLDGKTYERLLVYFHPLDREPNEFSIGVGETDKDGVLVLRTSAGPGIATGNYRVTFSCIQALRGGKTLTLGAGSEKADDDRSLVTKDIVPPQYGSKTESPVEFQVKSGENIFEFDIPGK
ncbi:hypothetical protein DTL21_18795 [Bremerella cremea]|uniref:Uncharacterized protein n=1 Tax=Blastopirellula marina TaxID=124 RepID=A0A2S8FK20_9BACT|nr:MULTISPECIES: hypothetical protein [Pirellulaceae]PQO32274.1 hypothetical protein C5Y83_18775 [Blastopirellula marina]RCS45341.1 hypothetical protein DTL21_18795 [Bremerella cremea]